MAHEKSPDNGWLGPVGIWTGNLDFLPTDIRNGGKFNGFMISGGVAF